MLVPVYKYLILHDHVSIPGIGSFTVQHSPSGISDNTILPPKQHIAFEAGSALTDKQFYQFLAAETGMNEVESVRKFQDFAYQLRKDIQSNPHIGLNGFGTFRKTPTGEITFEPVVTLDHYFTPVAPSSIEKNELIQEEEAVVESNETVEEVIIKRDYWWIWAIIFTILALAAIGYFYIKGEII